MSDAESQDLDNIPSDASSSISIVSHDVNNISSSSWSDYSSLLVSSVHYGSSSDDTSLTEYHSNKNDESFPTVNHIISDTNAEPNTSWILTTADIWRVKAHRKNSFIDYNIDWKSPMQCH